MALGALLRTEREARGLTEAQVAEATRMMAVMITELENEDFHRFTALIYGKGFIKMYAQFLQLDPVPLLQEFEQLYTAWQAKAEAEKALKKEEPTTTRRRFGFNPRFAPRETPVKKDPAAKPERPATLFDAPDEDGSRGRSPSTDESLPEGVTRDLFGNVVQPPADTPSLSLRPRAQRTGSNPDQPISPNRSQKAKPAPSLYEEEPHAAPPVPETRSVLRRDQIGIRKPADEETPSTLRNWLGGILNMLRPVLDLWKVTQVRIAALGAAFLVALVIVMVNLPSCLQQRNAPEPTVIAPENMNIGRLLPPPAGYAD